MLHLIDIYHTRGIGDNEYKYKDVYNDETGKIEQHLVYTWSCFGEGGDDIVTVPATPEILEIVKQLREQELIESAKRLADHTNEKIDKINESLPYQKKGQTVTITKGKNKGFTGVVFWEGADRYSEGSGRSFMQDTILKIIADPCLSRDISGLRIGVKDENGVVVFINAEKCLVVEGFEPLPHITLERAIQIVTNRRQNMNALQGRY